MKYLSALLIVIALAMVALGLLNQIIPPILTGVGFIVVAVMFLSGSCKK